MQVIILKNFQIIFWPLHFSKDVNLDLVPLRSMIFVNLNYVYEMNCYFENQSTLHGSFKIR